MTPVAQIKTVSPTHHSVEAMTLMTEHNIRHLPVIEGGDFLGMLSIRDVVENVVREAKKDVEEMESYIQGGGY